MPYKHLIGEVLIDKAQGVTTVISKLHDVGTESVFRTFPYEVLAGPDDMNVAVRHADCEFKFNFAEVYWNTRLGHEHERLVGTFEEGQAVCDAMAGVGPFAVPAGKKKVWVRANDLNPAGYHALAAAIETNKVSEYVSASCMDGAEFIKISTKELLQKQRSVKQVSKFKISRDLSPARKVELIKQQNKSAVIVTEPSTFDHFVMNLPASAIEFLWAFKGLYHGHEPLFEYKKLPLVHVYTFQAKRATEEEERAELTKRLSQHLDYNFTADDEVLLHRARLVAPNKLYYCATFRLPAAVAFAAAK